MPDGRVCNWPPVLLTALPEVPEPVVTAPAFFCPLAVCVALSFTMLLAASQHLPADADDLCFIDAAPATDVASTSTAAAVMSLFMMFSCAAHVARTGLNMPPRRKFPGM